MATKTITSIENLDLDSLPVAELTRLIRERLGYNSDTLSDQLRWLATTDPMFWWQEFGLVRRILQLAATTIEAQAEELAQWS